VTVDSIVRSTTGGSVEIKSRPNFVARVELVTVKSPRGRGNSSASQ
jgi:hypothetical protein